MKSRLHDPLRAQATPPSVGRPNRKVGPRRSGGGDSVARGTRVFAIPALVVTAALVVIPIGYTVWLSITDVRADGASGGFAGLATYTHMVEDPLFWQSLRVTLFFLVVCLVFETILGLALGYLLNLDVPGRQVFQGMMLIPAITASVAVGLIWLLIYDPTLGAANQILEAIGIKPLTWLGDPTLAPWAIAIVDIWQWTPFMALIIAAGIRNLPVEPFEAAEIDGAKAWQKAMYVGLPLLRPVITVAILLRTVDLIRFFDTVYVMTQGGPVNATNTLNVYGYREAFIDNQTSYAAALQVTLLLLVLVIAAGMTWVRRRTSNVS